MGQGGDMHLPGPLRAAVGLVATAADEAKHLPDRAIELPMLVVSTALQASLRAQQRYARFTARGDEVLTRRPVSDAPPEWATFDDPPVDDLRRARFDDADMLTDSEERSLAQSMVGSLFGVADPGAPTAGAPNATEADRSDTGFETARRTEAARKTAAAKTTSAARRDDADRTPGAAKAAPAEKATPAEKAAATKKATPAKKAAAKKTTARKSTARKTAAKKTAAKKATSTVRKTTARKTTANDTTADDTTADDTTADEGAANEGAANAAGTDARANAAEPSTKAVHKPRHTTPSAFDDVDDD